MLAIDPTLFDEDELEENNLFQIAHKIDHLVYHIPFTSNQYTPQKSRRVLREYPSVAPIEGNDLAL